MGTFSGFAVFSKTRVFRQITFFTPSPKDVMIIQISLLLLQFGSLVQVVALSMRDAKWTGNYRQTLVWNSELHRLKPLGLMTWTWPKAVASMFLIPLPFEAVVQVLVSRLRYCTNGEIGNEILDSSEYLFKSIEA